MLSFLISPPIAVTFSFLGLVILGVLLSRDLPISLILETVTDEIEVGDVAVNLSVKGNDHYLFQ